MTWKDCTDPTRLTDKDLNKIFSKSLEYDIARTLLNSCYVIDPYEYEYYSLDAKRLVVIDKLIKVGCSINIKPIFWKHTYSRYSITATFHSEYLCGIRFNSLSPEQLIEFGFLKVRLNPILVGYQIPTWYGSHISNSTIFKSNGHIQLKPDLTLQFLEVTLPPEYLEKTKCSRVPPHAERIYTIQRALKDIYLAYAMLPYGNTKK